MVPSELGNVFTQMASSWVDVKDISERLHEHDMQIARQIDGTTPRVQNFG